MQRFKFLCFLFLLFTQLSTPCFTQEKYEKESRIKEVDVPERALTFIHSLSLKKRVRWFKEDGLNAISYEAKFKHNNARYSVEFDSLGNIEDLEIEVKWDNLDLNIREAIARGLMKSCDSYKIRKVQVQYSGSEALIFSQIIGDKQGVQPTICYELVVKCVQAKNVELAEYLFNGKGEMLSRSIIVFKNSSHLEY